MQTLRKDNRGAAHLIILVVAVLLVVAGIGYYVWSKQKGTSGTLSTPAAKEALAKCESDDKDLCKFFASWQANGYYSISSKDTNDGKTSTSTYKSEGTDKFHMTLSGETSYEMIIIGDTTYTKDPSDNKWWKQTVKPAEKDKYKDAGNVEFKDDSKDETVPAEKKTTYKKIGTEACGKLTCFKYQVIEPEAKESTQYIWFDNKDYQIRRQLTQTGANSSDQSFSYDKFTISAPSPTKDLGANQVIVPGSSEPLTIPSGTDTSQLLDAGLEN